MCDVVRQTGHIHLRTTVSGADLFFEGRFLGKIVLAGDEMDLGAWPVAEGSSPSKAGTTCIRDYSSPPAQLGKIANWYVHPGLIDLGLLRG